MNHYFTKQPLNLKYEEIQNYECFTASFNINQNNVIDNKLNHRNRKIIRILSALKAKQWNIYISKSLRRLKVKCYPN